MNNLILVRHGQSLWNKEKRFTGWADIDLTDRGKNEAEYAGQLIKKLNIEFNEYFTSFQKRAITTLNIILEVINNNNNTKINKAWELNERHYGDLTGLNKDEMKKKHGEKQVHIWRRSFDIQPPAMKLTNSYHPLKNSAYAKIPKNKIPDSESLKNTFERVVPYYENNIEPLLFEKKNILISAHGNSLRALCKFLFKLDEIQITKLEIPTGNPLMITFGEKNKISKCRYLDQERAQDLLVF